MERHGYITKEEREIASKMTVDKLLADKHESIEGDNEYQAFIDTVLEEMEADGLNPYKNAYEVYTTMHRAKQDHINKIMNGETWDWKDDKVTAGIAVVDVANGNIVAVGGGRNKTDKLTLNTATQIRKQIGSTAKPLYDYSVGIEYENWSTYEPMTDENITYSDGTSLNNWDGKYQGFLTLRTALAQSRNTSAVKAFRKNKNNNIREVVTKLKLNPEEYLHEAHAIGGYSPGEAPLTTAAAYATFANGGVYNTTRSYYKIVNKNNGEVIEKDTESTKVFSPQTAYIMTDLLQSSAKVGLGAYSNVNGCVYGAKTGTSNFSTADKKAKGLNDNAINDYWVSGVSPDYAISVWYGYEKPDKEYHNVFGTTYHERLFQAVAKGIFKKESSFKNPGGISKVQVENYTYPAKLPSEYTPKDLIVTELFKTGTEPTEQSDRFSKLEPVKNLKSSIEGNKLTLSWDAISTPSALDEGKIKELSEKLFETSGFQNKFVSSIKSYNSNSLGSLIYRVYAKKTDGTVEELESTSNTTITINVNESSPTTYIVKSSYSIFTANMSDGVEINVSLEGVKDKYELALIGETNKVVTKGTYTEEGVMIIKNGEKTDLKPTLISYIDKNTNTSTTMDLMNQTPGIYTVTYSYKENSITRTITIQ
jgi:penicillin-binding protein 1A